VATGTYAPDPDLRIVDANGVPVSGGLIWTYLAGTVTPVATFTDVGLAIPNSNPIVAGSDGRFVAFLTPGLSYKFVYEQAAIPPAHGAVIETRDNILGVPLSISTTMKVINRTDSGTITGLDVGLTDNTLVEWTGSGNLIVNGLAGGVTGRMVTFKNISGTAGVVMYFPHVIGPVGMQFRNPFTNGTGVPVAYQGWVTYLYDGNFWILVSHDQGAWIDVPFNAAWFVCDIGTWTMPPANMIFYRYKITARTCLIAIYIRNSTLSGAPNNCNVKLPDNLVCEVQNLGVYSGFNTASYCASTHAIPGGVWYFYAGFPTMILFPTGNLSIACTHSFMLS
jgi:hypothetical protein